MIGPFISLTTMSEKATMGGDKAQETRILIPVHMLGPIKEIDGGCLVAITGRADKIKVNESFDEIIGKLGGKRNG